MAFEDEELILTFKSIDDTEIALIISSPSGRKIEISEFLHYVEQWLNEVTRVQNEREKLGQLLH